ncbi:hypothetical protein [Streptomyces sp. NPDC058249]|uniref:hypothetical protein n=1 Tax=Streptomyces sp. NPDC058249 TaxID=3346403 RepID=UPI0036E983E8
MTKRDHWFLAAAALMLSLIVGTTVLTRTPTELAFAKGPFGSREAAGQWLTRMLQLVRPARSEHNSRG